MRIRILESAVADLAFGKDFYERQEIGVGDYFQDCLFSDIDSLLLYAGIHRKLFGYHRMLSKRFPYAIYYQVDSEVILIIRVLDCRKDPLQLRKALGQG